MSIRQVFAILWARRLTAIVAFAMTVLSAVVFALVWPPRYDGVAAVFINMAESDPVSAVRQDLIPTSVQRNYLQTQMELLRSMGVARKVVEILGLAKDEALRQKYQASASRGADRTDFLARQLLSDLKVERVGSSDIISVVYRAGKPEDAAKIANAIVSAYLAMNVELRARPAWELYQWYEEQLKPLQQQLAEAETRRSALHEQSTVRGGTVAPVEGESSTLMAELTAARLGVIQARIALDEAKGGMIPQSEEDETKPIRRQISELNLRINREVGRLGPAHAVVRSLEATRAVLEKQLSEVSATATSGAMSEAEARLRAAERKFAELSATIDAPNRPGAAQSASTLVVATAEVEALKGQIATTRQRLTRLRLESSVEHGPASLLTAASVPQAPSFPQLKVVLALAAGFGLAFGICLAILREMLDRRIRCPEDVTAYTTISVFAVLPRARVRRTWPFSHSRSTKRHGVAANQARELSAAEFV